MRLINGHMFLEVSEMLQIGISEDSINSGLRRYRKNESPLWECINDARDNRKVLIKFDSLTERYKNLIKDKLFNGIEPKEAVKAKVLEHLLILKPTDEQEIKSFRTPKGELLPKTKLDAYLQALQYISLLAKLTAKQIHDLGFYNAPEFYQIVINDIKAKRIYLPHSYGKLNSLKNAYKKQGALAIVEGYFKRNPTNLKISKEQADLINHLYSLPNQYTTPQITAIYNRWASENGWKRVCERTVYNHIKEIETTHLREGLNSWRNVADPVISRNRPSKPNLIWVGDGCVYELYYQKSKSYWERKVVYMVIDAFNDFIVGYAIGDTESNNLARNAWRNACISNNVLPHQIKTDNYGRKEMQPFYEQIVQKAHYYTPSAVGNARDKVIEPMFARLYNEVTRQHRNASGRNITAKEQPNRDFLDKIKYEFPDETGVIQQIENDIKQWNEVLRSKTGNRSLKQQWTEGDHTEDRLLNISEKLEIFGTRHKHTIKQSSQGIVFTAGGITRKYFDWNSIEFAKRVGQSFHVIYDELDFSNILVIDETDRNKFVIPADTKNSMYVADRKHNEATDLNKKLRYKKQLLQETGADAYEERIRSIQKLGMEEEMTRISAEGAFKLRPTINGDQKQLSNKAQSILKINTEEEIPTTKKLSKKKPSSSNNERIQLKPVADGLESIFQDEVPAYLRIIKE